MPLWTCLGCQAQATSNLVSCPRCGLPRPGAPTEVATDAPAGRYPGVPTLILGIALLLLVVVATITGIGGELVIDGTTPNPILFGGGFLGILVTVAALIRIAVEAVLRSTR